MVRHHVLKRHLEYDLHDHCLFSNVGGNCLCTSWIQYAVGLHFCATYLALNVSIMEVAYSMYINRKGVLCGISLLDLPLSAMKNQAPLHSFSDILVSDFSTVFSHTIECWGIGSHIH